MTQGECECCVLDALDVGYRSIDTAQSYFNEEQVGSAIQKSGVTREEIFLATKVWLEHYGYEAAKASVLESMRKLRAVGISNFYVDRMVDFASFNRIKPMVNQMETHILNQQKVSKEWAEKYGIQLEAWAPFGEGRGDTFGNPVIMEIAKSTARALPRLYSAGTSSAAWW
ncbi:aldo/keto reductase [uncultured Oscillibacter sp.]|uniref:aldo/keto reductase n=1 Tax=uncultured Oscillibacter sp. TaxID=876091 RepID=UPI00341C906F